MSTDDQAPWCDDVATLQQLYARGLVRQTARRRIKRGAWRELVPGVVVRTTGPVSRRQWLVAALSYGGDGAAISHDSAGEFWGFGTGRPTVHVTVPHGRHLRSTDTVRVHQSRRPFRPSHVEEIHVTPPARTAVDMGLQLSSRDAVTALFGRALQKNRVTVETLSQELDIAPSRGSLIPRLVMADLAAGSRAASESRLVQLIRTAGLPMPEFNGAVSTALGTRYVDALWRALGKGVEIDGQAFHLDPASWRADLIRQNAIQTTGIVLLRIAAHRLWTEPASVVEEITAFLGLGLSTSRFP